MDEIVNFSIDEAGTIIVPDSYESVPKLSDTNKIGVRQIILGDAAPLVVISGLIAKYGLNYQFVVIKADGSEKIL